MPLERKLSPAKVKKARDLAAEGQSQAEIARLLGVSQPTIFNLLSGKTYQEPVKAKP